MIAGNSDVFRASIKNFPDNAKGIVRKSEFRNAGSKLCDLAIAMASWIVGIGLKFGDRQGLDDLGMDQFGEAGNRRRILFTPLWCAPPPHIVQTALSQPPHHTRPLRSAVVTRRGASRTAG
jgi:hypothetical protein